MVRKFAAALNHHGLQSRDRLADSQVRPLVFLSVQDERFSRAAAVIANRTTSIAIALVTASLGGILTNITTDMGVKVPSACVHVTELFRSPR